MKITEIVEEEFYGDFGKLREEINKLNKARLGAFGEFIFQSIAVQIRRS